MPVTPAPRTALFNSTTQVFWSDGVTPFNGYALVGLVMPTTGGTAFSNADLGYFYPGYPLPNFVKAPIVNGYYDGVSGLFYNTDMTPPLSRYVAWYYDMTDRQIAGPSTFFTVTGTPVLPPSLTLPIPVAGSVLPIPG